MSDTKVEITGDVRNNPRPGDVLVLMTGRIRYYVLDASYTMRNGVPVCRIQTLREPNESGLYHEAVNFLLPYPAWRDLAASGATPAAYDWEGAEKAAGPSLDPDKFAAFVHGEPSPAARESWNTVS